MLLLISLIIYYFLNSKTRLVFLLVLSSLFIASLSINLLIYVLIFSLINWLLGQSIANKINNKSLFRFGILINILQLILLRYYSFTLDPLLELLDLNWDISALSKFIVPIGISYFTLQGIGYLINIKMGWEKPEGNILRFLLYIIFFPKYLSGPIERSNHFLPQLNNLSGFKGENLSEGFKLILVGFLKKDVIANQLSLFITPVYGDIDSMWGMTLWIVLLVQPLYVYFDFSGYTDIAIGMAKTFGFTLLPNFNKPFLVENATSFWKRFYLSLTFWVYSYIFKHSIFLLRRWKSHATTFALFVTWTLFGIWHGAGWNFMVLGFIQAIAIYFEFVTKKERALIFSKFTQGIRKWTGRGITYFFYGISLIFFFSSDLSSSIKFLSGLLRFGPIVEIGISDKIAIFAAFGLLLLLLFLEVLNSDNAYLYNKIKNIWTSRRPIYKLVRFSIYYFIIVIIFYFGGMQTEFIYFQF